MRKLLFKIFSIAFLVCMLLLSCEKKEETVINKGSISGIITNSTTNEPLEGVNVTLSPNESSSVTTGTDGKYTFSDIKTGNYSVQMVKENFETTTKNVTVTTDKTTFADVSLKAITPIINISTENLDFGENITSMTVDIKNIGGGVLQWAISENVDWISVNPTSGSITTEVGVISILVDRSNLSVGSYTQNISITSNGGSKSIVINATVAEGPILTLSNENIDFGENTSVLALDITNTGNDELDWAITESADWLTISPISGQTNAETDIVTLTVDRSELLPGDYNHLISISSNGGSKTVNILASVMGPVLSVTPLSLDFGNTEINKTLFLSNNGLGTLSFEATTNENWLSITPSSGSLTTNNLTATVLVDRSVVSPGDYSGSIVFNTNSNSISIPVNMSVTAPSAPTVICQSPSNITWQDAQISGNLLDLGTSPVTQRGHCWSTSPNPSITNNITTLGGTSTIGNFSSTINGLSTNTLYYVRAYATNSVGTAYSEQVSFTTLGLPTLPTVLTLSISNVSYNSSHASGNLTNLGDGYVSQRGFCYSESPNPSINDHKVTLGGTSSTGSFSGNLTNLTEITTYYVKAFATNSLGTSYGEEISFTTTEAPPVVTNGLIAYYTFDDQTANDWTGNWNGINQGCEASIDIPNSNGYSMSFNGSSNFINVPGELTTGFSQISISVWIKTSVSNDNIICNKYSHGNAGIWIDYNKIYCYESFSSSIDYSTLLLDNEWHLLVCTISPNGDKKYYVDSILTDSFTLANVFGSGNFKIGNRSNNYFNGKMDNFRVYNRAISASEVQEIYEAIQ